MAVTKDPAHESPSRLRSLAPQGTPVVMSSAAWNDYGVPAAPYFVYLEGDSDDGRLQILGQPKPPLPSPLPPHYPAEIERELPQV